MPRTGAFEVSFKGILIFSKLNGSYWPDVELVAEKVEAVVVADAKGKDVTAYLAGNTTMKGGGFQSSARKNDRTGSKSPRRSHISNSDEASMGGRGLGGVG